MRKNSRGVMKHWLINKNTGQDHKCISGDKPIIRNSQQKGMPCKYKCGKYVEFYNDYYKSPKFQEVDTYRQHTYQRCGNLLIQRGIQPPFRYVYLLEIFDYPLYDQWKFVQHLPPESKFWDYLRPKVSVEDFSMIKRGVDEPESQKAIRKMSLVEFKEFMIKLGHLKPMEPTWKLIPT
jgi:hypothetical protein